MSADLLRGKVPLFQQCIIFLHNSFKDDDSIAKSTVDIDSIFTAENSNEEESIKEWVNDTRDKIDSGVNFSLDGAKVKFVAGLLKVDWAYSFLII